MNTPIETSTCNALSKNKEYLQRAIETWENFNHDKTHLISNDDIQIIESLSDDEIEKYLVGSLSVIYGDILQAISNPNINNEEKPFLESFLTSLSSYDLPTRMIRSALNQGACYLSSPFSNGHSKCSESFHLTHLTLLRFVDYSGEAFFIIQQVTAADLIYFPTRKLAIVIKYATLEYIPRFAKHLCNTFTKVINYSCNRKENQLRGVITSFPRPYHFYYEIFHGVYSLTKANLLTKVPEIIFCPGSDFFSFKELYNLNCRESIEYFVVLEEKNFNSKKFAIHIGIPYQKEYSTFLKNIDHDLVEYSLASMDKETEIQISSARSCFPLIWFGVTGQKRAWLEQINGIASIITSISKVFPGLGVIFDGWTSSLVPTAQDILETRRDNEIAENIISSIPSQVRVFNVIGFNTKLKIPFAKIADCFVSNASTGSLHIARFAEKPGIGHISNAMLNSPMSHIGEKMRIIPNKFITDEPNKEHKESDHTSYSINPEIILNMLIDIIKELSIPGRFELHKNGDHKI